MVVEVKPMEPKKTHQSTATSAKEASVPKMRVRDLIEEVKSEFSKITWTNRDELLAYTKLVVGGTFVFGMGIYLVDLLIRLVLGGLESIIRWIAG